MKKRLALVWTMVVLGAVLALPATTAAGTAFQWETLRNLCTETGGRYGYGQSVLSVRLYEWGRSGATQFRVRASAQYQRLNGSWQTVRSWNWIYSVYFGNGSDSNYFQKAFKFQWGSRHYNYFARLIWRGEWLNSNGRVIGSQNLTGARC